MELPESCHSDHSSCRWSSWRNDLVWSWPLLMLLGFGSNGLTAETAPAFLWAKQSQENLQGYVAGLALDDAHNSYLLGCFPLGIRFDHIALTNGGAFIVKYDGAGNVVWAIREGERGWYGTAIAVDPRGNVYAIYEAASDRTNVNIGGVTFTAPYSTWLVLAKYDLGGRRLWAQLAGKKSGLQTSQLIVDSTGNCYWTLLANSPAKLGETAVNRGSFIAKYDTDGNQIWIRQLSGENHFATEALDSSNHVFAAGTFTGRLRIGLTNLMSRTNEDGFSRDVYLAKYSGAGQLLWVRAYGGEYAEHVTRIATDAFGNCFLAGGYYQKAVLGSFTLEGDLTDYSQYVMKVNSGGDVLWARKVQQSSTPGWEVVETDVGGNCYVACRTSGVSVFKYDGNGNPLWEKAGPAMTTGYFKVGPAGYCFLGGGFTEPEFQVDRFTLVNPRRVRLSHQFFVAMLDTTSSPWLALPPQTKRTGKPGVIYMGTSAGFNGSNSTSIGQVSNGRGSNGISFPTSGGKMLIQSNERQP